jgi:ribosomal protein S12 methylthiotransferase
LALTETAAACRGFSFPPFQPRRPNFMLTVSLISLGCAKNLVDSEIMIGHLHQAGMRVIPEAEKADVVIVNTCSFIDSSKEESIGHILELHQNRGMKKRRKEQKLIVAGCMAQRFSKDLATSLHDEVDAFIGLDQVTKVAPIIEAIFAKERGNADAPVSFIEGRSTYIPDYDTPRFRLTPKHFAYVKIAEGCNHPCTFCIIPQIRGRHRSRTVESVVAEARQLVKEGVRELNLISQDTTFFGMDTWAQRPNPRTPVDSSRGTALTTLLRELNAIEGDFWIRLLYTHPAHWSDELIRTIAECPKVARYIDIPLQHISDHMLGQMQRETSGGYIRDLLRRIRAGIPGIALRTTFIVGFPGETDADVDELCAFIRETKFERLGVFRYSQEEGTRAAKLADQLPAKVKEARWHRTMALQKEIAARVSESFVGRTLRVLVEEPGVARGEADAPDIDGRVYVPRELPVGEFAEVSITGCHDYDLLALPLGAKPAEWKLAKQAQ